MTFDDWVIKWRLPADAVHDLLSLLNGYPGPMDRRSGMAETVAQRDTLMEYSEMGAPLWRNNVGGGKLANGRYMRWGLCNDSPAVNARLKSSDLIGVQPVVIQPRHVGQTFGLFIARETKRPGWVYRGTDREKAQAAYLALVNSLGGDGKFSVGRGSYVRY